MGIGLVIVLNHTAVAHVLSIEVPRSANGSVCSLCKITPRMIELDDELVGIEAVDESRTGTRIIDLNDYCLLEIFESLNLMDLCSLAETCDKFRNITLRIAPKQLRLSKNDIVLFGCKTDREPTTEQSYRPNEIARIFKNFGSILTAVSISEFHWRGKHFIIHLVATFCGRNLKSLKLNSVSLFKGTDGFPSIVEKTFPQLERFSYVTLKTLVKNTIWDADWQHPVELVTDFIGRHSNLKVLSLRFGSAEDSCTRKAFQTINDSCKELQKLSFGYGDCERKSFRLYPLHQLTSLTTLSLHRFEVEGVDFFSALTNLRVLRLRNCLHQNSEQWPQSGNGVVEIISAISNLEELEIWTHNDAWILDANTFSRIVSVVRSRPKALILRCDMDFNAENLSETNGNVKLILTKWNWRSFYSSPGLFRVL